MDAAIKFVLAYGWQRPTTTYILVCQNGLCRHGWTVSTTATPSLSCPQCGTCALIVDRVEPGQVVREYMAEQETKQEHDG